MTRLSAGLFRIDPNDDEAVRTRIRTRADMVYHPVGSCKRGQDEMTVTDDRLRVRGRDGIRVADATITPTIIGGNTNAPTIMIAEKPADMLRASA